MDDNEIKRRLTGRAAEYMMFKDDEEDTEAPVDITSTGNVIVFPDFEKLKSEVEKMRTELSMLLLERDELQFVICKNIETEYMLKLGSIEYKAYKAQCAALRLKRKIELIQAKKNRQEKVIISAIEETLDSEFAEYQKQLNEQIDKMNDALKRSKAEVSCSIHDLCIRELIDDLIKLFGKPAANGRFTLACRAAGGRAVIFAGEQQLQHFRQQRGRVLQIRIHRCYIIALCRF